MEENITPADSGVGSGVPMTHDTTPTEPKGHVARFSLIRWARKNPRIIARWTVFLVGVWVFFMGLAGNFPEGDFNAVVKSDAMDHGDIVLTYYGTPSIFHAVTYVDFFDQQYTHAYLGSEPIVPGKLSSPPQRGHLVQVMIHSQLVAPYKGKNTPERIPWTLATTVGGQFGPVASVEDGGKLRDGSCSLSVIATRVPDNALPVHSGGIDPTKLSFGYLNAHPESVLPSPGRTPGTLDLSGVNGSAFADQETLDNTHVPGKTTVYAGTACAQAPIAPRNTRPSPECSKDKSFATFSIPSGAEDDEVARALGQEPSRTEVYECLSIAGIVPPVGDLRINSFLEHSFVHESANGGFALHVPRITVRSLDRDRTVRLLPTRLRLYDSELIANGEGTSEEAPEYPIVPPERLKYIEHAAPNIERSCNGTKCGDVGGLLEWVTSGDNLDVSLSGTVVPVRDEYERHKETGILEWTIGLTLMSAVALGLLVSEARKRTARHGSHSRDRL